MRNAARVRVSREAVVVGGGIGGLCAAIGLRTAGWRVTVLEQAAEFAGIGAGLTLMPNALRALDALGLGETFRALRPVRLSGGLRTSSGRWLSRFDADAIAALLGESMVAVHRADLLDMLRAALPPGAVRTGCRVDDVPDADLVVAADGINSTLRARLWPDAPKPVYQGITAWRGVTEWSGESEIGQTWGPQGGEFGIVPMADGRIYWFGALPAPAGQRYPDERAAALARFGGWHPPIAELIESTAEVLHHDIYHLPEPPATFVRDNVVLLGDAAHAMTPNLGQGGCQAIEDAVVLAAAVADHPRLPDALARYDRQRRPRTRAVARRAAQVGRVIAMRNPIAVRLRNALVAAIPNRIGIRGMGAVADWRPPTIRADSNPGP